MAFSQLPIMFTRVRSRSTPAVVTYTSNEHEERRTTGGTVCGYGQPTKWGKAAIRSTSKSEIVRDVVTSNFRKRISNGEVINNPFQSETVSIDETQPVEINHEMIKSSSLSCSPTGSVKNKTWLTGPVLPPSCPNIGTTAMDAMRQSVINLAVTQAHANIDTSSLLALASAVEGRKTVQSILDISSRAVSILRNVRKLNIRALRKEISPNELSDRYMEARYAIRPLIYDAHGVYSYVKAERKIIRQTYRGYASDSTTATDTTTTAPFWSYSLKWNRKCVYTVSARAGVLCDVNVTSLGLAGVDQLAETALELVPFSFIADWFANISDTIAAWTPNAGVTQRASWVTVRETRTFTNSLTGATSNFAALGYASASISIGSTTYEKRELFTERIVSPALSTFPQANLNLDLYKLSDLSIILRNLLK